MIKVIGDYFRGVRAEFTKVHWPTRAQFIRGFVSVVVGVAVTTVVVVLIDSGLRALIKTIIGV